MSEAAGFGLAGAEEGPSPLKCELSPFVGQRVSRTRFIVCNNNGPDKYNEKR